MKPLYIPSQFEKKWIDQWEKEQVYKTKPSFAEAPEGKAYILDMFPYPSGVGLHVGHVRGYAASDILARFYRMKGKSVLHPMGWDAFGLPAENAAIKAKKNPMDMVPANIANFKRQMKQLGLSYDWNKEFSTTDPQYYKWTQWLFIQFFKMGLLYKKETPIFYCPVCKTGLAQEEVLSDGRHERCGNKVEERTLPQWIFRITKYADRLLADLEGLDWPKGILQMQRNWIGRKEGMEIKFKVQSSKFKVKDVTVFTTRPDTIEGVTFIVVSPKKGEELGWGNKEKDTSIVAINPATNEHIPVWIGEYVLDDVGTGIVMGVPEHDERDRAFAKKHGLSVRHIDLKKGEKWAQNLVEKGTAKKVVTYHLRDWIFSRQRYWGEPIPMIFCAKCSENKISFFKTEKFQISNFKFQIGEKNTENKSKTYENISKWVEEVEESSYGWFPIPEDQLPLELPYVKSYEPTETGESPLSQISDFVNVTCPNCGEAAKRETDTMPNWAGSCWYFLYFAREGLIPLSHHQVGPPVKPVSQGGSKRISSPSLDSWKSLINLRESIQWLPVDWYLGGAEHAVLHLLYARFWVKAMSDLGLVSITEPFKRLRNVGMVIAPDSRKMSKSFGNVITPDDVAEFGMDALRVYEMFMAPFSQEVAWSDSSMQGSFRFLKRIWHIYHDTAYITDNDNEIDKELSIELQSVISKVSSDITNVKFNTAISTLMTFLNKWEKSLQHPTSGKLGIDSSKVFLKLLSPFAPFMTEEIWRTVLKENESIHISSWPEMKGKTTEKETLTIPIQINGKHRGTIRVPSSQVNEKEIVAIALTEERVKKYLEGQSYKAIYVPGKILNFVVKE